MNTWLEAILLGVICFWAGHRAGQGKPFIYIGSDKEKYDKALIGIRTKKKGD